MPVANPRQSAIRRRYGIHVIRSGMGLWPEMPLGDRRHDRTSAESLFQPNSRDFHVQTKLHSVEHRLQRPIRYRTIRLRNLSQSDIGRGLLDTETRPLSGCPILLVRLPITHVFLRRTTIHVLSEKQRASASYYALLRIFSQ